MKQKIILAALLLAGCATQSGVIPEGRDGYLLILSGGYGFASAIDLKIRAHQEAGAFCMGQNQRPETIYEKTIPAGIEGDKPGEELKFRCVATPDALNAPSADVPAAPAPSTAH